jgi:hypothetical protein
LVNRPVDTQKTCDVQAERWSWRGPERGRNDRDRTDDLRLTT